MTQLEFKKSVEIFKCVALLVIAYQLLVLSDGDAIRVDVKGVVEVREEDGVLSSRPLRVQVMNGSGSIGHLPLEVQVVND